KVLPSRLPRRIQPLVLGQHVQPKCFHRVECRSLAGMEFFSCLDVSSTRTGTFGSSHHVSPPLILASAHLAPLTGDPVQSNNAGLD
ncbi:hypothetical protein BaRGS_00002193, partial [Batillaria attramentaria]